MEILELLAEKRAHLERFANRAGAAGENEVLANNSDFIPRPKGLRLTWLLEALQETGISIKRSSFDAIAVTLHSKPGISALCNQSSSGI